MRLLKVAALTALTCLLAATASAETARPSPSTTAPSPRPPVTAPAAAPTTSPASAPAQAALIDINSAPREQLDALPQIGSARAEAIVKGRPYRAKNELIDRKIIPQNAYDAIKDKIVARQKS